MKENWGRDPVKETYHVCTCNFCSKSFDTEWTVCPSCGSKDMDYERKRVRVISASAKRYQMIVEKARIREEALDYDAAIQIWEKLGDIKEAARVRRLKARQKSVKVAQKVVHGDTIVKDSVLNRTNIGSDGDDKFTRLEKLTEMKEKGLIDDDEFKQMKKEILGK